MPDFSAMPEVFVSNAELATAVSRETKIGKLRKLGSRLYTRNLTEPPERIVQRNLWPLVAAYLPGALIADRTALENQPAGDGSVFLIADHKRDIILPGVTLRPRKGPPPLESDRPFIGSLRIASPSFDPIGRGAERRVAITVATAIRSPAACQRSISGTISLTGGSYPGACVSRSTS